MSKLFQENSQSIGDTPIIKFNHVTIGAKATVLERLKDVIPRIRSNAASVHMIWDAAERVVLKPVVEIPGSGGGGGRIRSRRAACTGAGRSQYEV
jgi:cysteine synthase